ncbi:head GIN domain-containing protein [Pseudoduganella chitinolytica]|uniref:DUF2807 domain-containing protein n=1 Tax=Pseudoduganella chitinolytica TaxID=34070 RepID=A0ABY8BM47_9BURK|nr:head GIN domain-containing protein [Pseudoduganella chitinolytica]WEF35379.1 DUF2807 domain-containing protein [Pseudoduganella chitinolytica]
MTTTLSRRLIAAIALLVPLAAPQASPLGWLIGGDKVQGSGKVVNETRQVGRFHGVELALAGNVEVRTGSDGPITIEADDNVLPLVETVVENGVLHIRATKKKLQLDTRRLKVVVPAREIDSLGVAGSGSIVADKLRGARLALELAGSGTIDATAIEVKAVSIDLAGSGNLRAAGNAETLEVSVAGSGNADAARLAARQVEADVAGSGHATVTARQSLAASVAGSGTVSYYGDPQVSRSIAGSGTVRRAGDAR